MVQGQALNNYAGKKSSHGTSNCVLLYGEGGSVTTTKSRMHDVVSCGRIYGGNPCRLLLK
jgi:hypothetical protein